MLASLPSLIVRPPSNDIEYEDNSLNIKHLQVPDSPIVTSKDAEVLDAFHVYHTTSPGSSSSSDKSEAITPPNSHNIPLPIPRVLQAPRTMTDDCIIELYQEDDIKRPQTPYYNKEHNRMTALQHLRSPDSNLTQNTLSSSLQAEIKHIKHYNEVSFPCKGKKRSKYPQRVYLAKFLFFAGFLLPPLWLIAIFYKSSSSRSQSVELQRQEWSQRTIQHKWRKRSQLALTVFFISTVLAIVLWLILFFK